MSIKSQLKAKRGSHESHVKVNAFLFHRVAFSGFDAETVSKFSEKKISSISADYDIEISLIRGVVDNANRILEVLN